MQMDLGCPSVPYEPEIYFVDEQGREPAAGMAHDDAGGVTVLALLRLARAFEKPTNWAAIEASEMLAKNLTLSQAGEALVTASPRQRIKWCWSRTGTLNDTGAFPWPHHPAFAAAAVWNASRWALLMVACSRSPSGGVTRCRGSTGLQASCGLELRS